jgi:hypothetical protein
MYNLIELLVWQRKSKTYRRLFGVKRRKPVKSFLVLNERAWDRLAGRLFSELPRDEAISVLNAIKMCAK